VLVRLRARPEDVAPGSSKIEFTVVAEDDPAVKVSEGSVFLRSLR
jgi:hypothetical protein